MDITKDFNLNVGLRIREIREAMQMTREQFSELCNISDSFLAAVESGKKSITSKTIYKICSNANISADYLIFGNSEGFECDTVLELLRQMDAAERDSALRILTEFSFSLSRAKSRYAKTPAT